MKFTKLLLVALLTPFLVCAHGDKLYQKMLDVNAEWAHHTATDIIDPAGLSLETDVDWIQLHLLSVHNTLSKTDVSHLDGEQRKNREEGLEALLKYALDKEFPKNITFAGRRPVFIDHRGVHCAVGHLITQSGHADISRRISDNTNYAYLRDIKDNGLEQWVGKSGFTASELAWIQPGYYQPINFQSVGGGVNGPVNAIISDQIGGLYVGGAFDSAGIDPAGNLANYHNGIGGLQWLKVGQQGLNAEVKDVLYHNGDLYVAGYFWGADSVPTGSGVVKWDGTKWESLGAFYVGALHNYVNDLEMYRDTLYAGGFFRSQAISSEFFSGIAKWDGTKWRATKANLTGEVRKLHVHNKQLIVAGDFQMNMGAPISNICAIDSTGIHFMPNPAPIYDVETFNNELYIATDFTYGGDTMGLAVYRNSKWEVLFDGRNTPKFNSGGVRALQAIPSNNALAIGGDFVIAPMIGNMGRNLALVRGSSVQAFGALDSTVRVLELINGSLYIGGDFTYSTFTPIPIGAGLNHIASVVVTPNFGLKQRNAADIDLYPNPASGSFMVRKDNNHWDQFELIDMSGRRVEVNYEAREDGWSFDVSGLPSGTYILNMKNEDIAVEKRVVIR